ncbi:hypothetical protein JHK85_036295 [Glycine max]|nr:hypothetical protein JHK85_036295 [Glycine max]
MAPHANATEQTVHSVMKVRNVRLGNAVPSVSTPLSGSRSIASLKGHSKSLSIGTNVVSFFENIKNLSRLRQLLLDDCRKLVSMSKLPPSLEKNLPLIRTLRK